MKYGDRHVTGTAPTIVKMQESAKQALEKRILSRIYGD
jgi:hypothetical protein